MSRPGVEVTSAAAAPPVGVPTDTSVAFIVSEAQRGPTDAPTRITSLDEYTATYGDRVTGVEGYDAVDVAFHEGVSAAYFMRIVDGAKAATADAAAIVAGNTADAPDAGAWGNDVKLDVVPTPGGSGVQGASSKAKGKNGGPPRSALLTYPEAQATGDTFMATVSYRGKIVQTSTPLTTRRELSDFLQQSNYVVLTGPDDDALIAAGSVTLAGGEDGTVPVADTGSLPAALSCIPAELGPGNLAAPGKSSYDDHAALLAHGAWNNRYAVLDGGSQDNAQQLISQALLLRGAEEDRYGMLWGPWAVVPGLAPGTLRTVPWSAIQLGLMAVNDRAGNVNQASAGGWGQSQYAVGLAQAFSAADCEACLYAGVCTARTIYGAIEAYAFRSLVDPSGPRSQWLQANWGRLNMAIVADSEAVGEEFVFAQLDGRRLTIANFGGSLNGMLKEYLTDGALFTDLSGDPTTAYAVNVGPAVNTIESLADGRLRAVLSVRMSPHAELVQIQIVKQAINVSLV